MSASDWTTFNIKQAAINGTGFVRATGNTINYDNNTYLISVTGTTNARSAISLTTTGKIGAATYNSSTGVLNIPSYAGTVTSVGLTSSDITVGGTSPITSSSTLTLTLPRVNSNAGSFTNANITVNAKGQITAASSRSSSNGWLLTGNAVTAGSQFLGSNIIPIKLCRINNISKWHKLKKELIAEFLL